MIAYGMCLATSIFPVLVVSVVLVKIQSSKLGSEFLSVESGDL